MLSDLIYRLHTNRLISILQSCEQMVQRIGRRRPVQRRRRGHSHECLCSPYRGGRRSTCVIQECGNRRLPGRSSLRNGRFAIRLLVSQRNVGGRDKARVSRLDREPAVVGVGGKVLDRDNTAAARPLCFGSSVKTEWGLL